MTLLSRLGLPAALLAHLLWLLYPQAFVANDPWAYSLRAFEIATGLDFEDGHVFDHRLGVVLPTALFYALFGVSVHSTNLQPLLSSWGVITTVWLALPDLRSRLMGALLCVSSTPLLFASVALYPDVVAASCMGASSLALFQRRRPLLAVTLLFIAFIAKLSAYWVLPIWAFAPTATFGGAGRERCRRFYLPVLVLGALLGAGYRATSPCRWVPLTLPVLPGLYVLAGYALSRLERPSASGAGSPARPRRCSSPRHCCCRWPSRPVSGIAASWPRRRPWKRSVVS